MAPPRLSDRARRMPASPIRRLAPHAVAARRAGKIVHALNIGQPDIPTPREVMERLRAYPEANVPYGPSQGLPEFLEALRTYYGRLGLRLSQEELFVTTGGSEAILFVVAALCDPGDQVLVFEPFYANYAGFSSLVGVEAVGITTRAEDGYHLPPRAAIEAAIGPRTRAILVCSPNNPTGTVYTDEEMELLADVCAGHDLWLVSDEVYREFAYDGLTHHSALLLSGIRDRVVVVDSLSKRASLCGARVGNVVCRNPDLMGAILKMGQARLCPPTVEQWAATAYVDVPPSYIEGVIAQYTRRRDVVWHALRETPGVTVHRPEGAFYVCARLPVDDAERFAIWLLSDFDLGGETVIFSPAEGFYVTPGLGRDEARIAYVLESVKMARCMEILTSALRAYPGRTVTAGT
ncbi:MAG TPA: pyridoxal phosphate-dependent aminotransferase [Candidatus Polarisedimenticolaceae bacterium]|nr:pyridoxal phosphate-dependent aminotransferase [Candidatus Polarisedimenticolaceae bacterium]